MRFRDRVEAGRLLARALEKYRGEPVVVYALPRGGVPVGAEVARHLGAPLDLVIPRKIGHPRNPEYAVCAVAENGSVACEPQVVAELDSEWLMEAIKREQAEARRRRERYLDGRRAVSAEGKTAIIADDGVATGLTMIAAILDVRDRQPKRVVVAVPVLPREVAARLRKYADEVVALDTPEQYLGSVGAYYERFEQLDDEEVVELLGSANVRGDGNVQGNENVRESGNVRGTIM